MYTDSIEQLRGTVGARQVKVRAETALAPFTTPGSGGWIMFGKFPELTGQFDINASLITTRYADRSADMSSITIRNLDPAVKERLRIRAAQHGRSMEAEARSILQSTLREPERLPARNLYERIRARFEPLGGADDLELPRRLPGRDPPRFD